MKCMFCGLYNADEDNFCRFCGGKLRKECYCWIKKKPYNCGQDKCPGYRLFHMEKQITDPTGS